jgi:hypothetical protein
MAGNITDFAILIDKGPNIATLPTGTVRAGSGQSLKIVIGKAATMATPFCNGIDAGGATGLLPFFALPAAPNFDGRFVIIGRVVGEPTYWGCTSVADLVLQCTALNNGNVSTFDDAPDANRVTNCKTYLDSNGYALSDNTTSFLASYFP